MTDRSAPDDALVLAYVDGTLAAPLRAEFETRLASDPDLRAELEGLRALRTLLDGDAVWGRDSAVDAPPAHLVEAIVRAEVAARPDEIRQAVALARSSPEAMKQQPLWARLQSWWLGGGVVVGAAAAVLFVVSRDESQILAPAAKTAAAEQTAAPVMPATTKPKNDKAGEGLVAAALDDNAGNASTADGAGLADNEAQLQGGLTRRALPDPAPEGGGGRAANEKLQKPEQKLELREEGKLALAKDAKADAFAFKEEEKPAEPPSPKKATRSLDGLRSAGDSDSDSFDDSGLDRGNAALGASAGKGPTAAAPAPPPPPPMAAPMDAPAPSTSSTAPTAPTTTTPTTTPPTTPPTTVGSGGYVSVGEATSRFREVVKAKKTAKIEQERKDLKARSQAADKSKGNRAPAAPGSPSSDMTPTEARDEIERNKRIDNASVMLGTAEHELAGGRANEAVELATRAEAAGAGSLGLAPASTQARAYVLLKRNADAARVGSRLLQGDPADPVLVDGMIAAADGASAIGDRRLAERLLQRALLPANKDAALRAKAQARLNTLRSKDAAFESDAVAPAKAAPTSSGY